MQSKIAQMKLADFTQASVRRLDMISFRQRKSHVQTVLPSEALRCEDAVWGFHCAEIRHLTAAAALALGVLGMGTAAWGKLTPEQVGMLPPPASHQVSFGKEIRPILEASCTKCHGRGRSKGDFRLDTRETLLKGGESGSAVISGKSEQSYLIELVSGLDPDNVMPRKGKKLTADEVGLLRAWIDQGLTWDADAFFGKKPPVNFTPHRPELPAARAGLRNPIDRLLGKYFETNQIKWPNPVSDRVFARRVWLDTIGLLPPGDELEKFVSERSKDKRERLVKRLLADNQRYAENWLSFWNDALRNDYTGTGYIDKGRKQITGWLFSALAANMPYDQFVAQLVNPTEESEGFSKGILWRGAVNASQVPPMQAAQNISQVFMGVNLKCASCHDSFINDWKLSDAYGLANIYADQPLELFECDKPTGKKAPMQFIFPELGPVESEANKPERLKQLAAALTSKQNGRLSRTIVNRLWQKFFGRGLVEPVDDMEQPAWNVDLLDWLAEDLVAHGFDLKHTIEQIFTSLAYQMPAANSGEIKDSTFVFRGPTVRRLSAEQFRDALGVLCGQWFTMPATPVNFRESPADSSRSKRRQAPSPLLAREGKWIWNEPNAAQKATANTVYLRKEIILPETPTEAFVVATCDSSFTLYLNGKRAASGNDWRKVAVVEVASLLVKGTNTIAVQAVKGPSETKSRSDWTEGPTNSAGFILEARIRHREAAKPSTKKPPKASVMDFATDASWLWTTNKVQNWEKPAFVPEDWAVVAELGEASVAPWNAGNRLTAAMVTTTQFGHVRSALVAADPLMVALGRPNREQVMTCRSPVATTLQMLELENGHTLSKLIIQGAEQLLSKKPGPTRELVARLYQGALGRPATGQELQSAEEIIGQPAKKEGVEDFLWAMTMLPEFQLIY